MKLIAQPCKSGAGKCWEVVTETGGLTAVFYFENAETNAKQFASNYPVIEAAKKQTIFMNGYFGLKYEKNEFTYVLFGPESVKEALKGIL